MNIFSKIGSFVKKEESAFVAWAKKEEAYVKASLPILAKVANIGAAVAAAAHVPAISIVEKYLQTAVTDATAVTKFVDDNQGSTVNNLLHNTAVFLGQYLPAMAGKDLAELDTIFQAGYSVYVK